MDFAPTDDQRMVVDSLRAFVERELYPHEAEVERLGTVPPELAQDVRRKALALGYYALNMPAEVGGGGLDKLTLAMCEREFGRASTALNILCGRPSLILLDCRGEQVEAYLKPTIRGERIQCVAMTEPGAGSDVRAMATRARRDGTDYILSGTKQFISNADQSDFFIVFAVTGEDGAAASGRPRHRITAFLVDHDLPGIAVTPLPCVSTRGYNPNIISLSDVRVPAFCRLGEEGQGFALAEKWLHNGRVMLSANSVGRGRRVLAMAAKWAASRKQFGQPIGRFQGVGFQLADMATDIEAAEMMVLHAAWKLEHGSLSARAAAMTKLFASEMIGRVTDHAVQIFGGMGLMGELPIERFWRDARLERIWEGTSEIQRYIIARDILAEHGG